MKLFFLFLGLVYASLTISQSTSKPVIDSLAIRNWPRLGTGFTDDVAISGDGSSFSYVYTENEVSNRILQLKNGKTYSLPQSIKYLFSADSKRFIYLSGNKLISMDIESGSKKTIPGVKSMQYPEVKKGKIIVYQMEGNKELIIEDLLKGWKKSLGSVSSFIFDKQGEQIAVYLKDSTNGSSLRCVHLISGKQHEIRFPKEETIESFEFSNSGKKIALIKSNSRKINSCYLWPFSSSRTIQLKADSLLATLHIDEYISKFTPLFSGDDRYLFFRVEKKAPIQKKDPNNAQLNIWNSHSIELPNTCSSSDPTKYRFSVSVVENNIVRLESDSTALVPSNAIQGDYVVVASRFGDQYWKEKVSNGRTFWLISMKNASKTALNLGERFVKYYYSPGGKYIVYCDFINGRWDYYSYNTHSNKVTNLSGNLPAEHLLDEKSNGELNTERNYPLDIIGWLPEEEAVLSYDSFDILKLYLSASKPVENITNGYGRRYKTRLAITYEDIQADKCYKSSDTLLLTAFNTITKYNGFYKKTLEKSSDPDSLAMLPRIICALGKRILPINSKISDAGIIPVKAAASKQWLVKCNSANSAPNYYLTSDFINYDNLTNVQPQGAYNWYTTELVHWRQYDGKQGTGVLYKPENFDSTQKYPVIIYHYRELSQRLNYYDRPFFITGPVDVPWFVSRGYLVLTPDVFLGNAGSGPAAYNAVASAAEWLGTLPFVNKTKIGLNGHSQAGFQTNYIVANTNLFAAALSGAGGADAIMSAFSVDNCGIDPLGRLSGNEARYGTLWEHYDLYRENSPILKADKITTPLLLFHCPKDNAVPWELSRQLFLALWRLGKDAWLLEYDEGKHLLGDSRDYWDYTIRVTQFFDHYLKDAPPPKWMTKGVPTELKSIQTGLELDFITTP